MTFHENASVLDPAEVSYVIAVRNGEHYVAEAISSVLHQTCPPLELTVVDDGSTDRTAEVVASFGSQLRYVSQDPSGVSAARNHGARLARGDFVGFLDADDRLERNKIRRQLDAFREQPGLEFCDGHAEFFWSEELSAEERESDFRYQDDFWRKVLPGQISTWLVRRELFDRYGAFDEHIQYSEDTDWYLRLRDGGAVMTTLSDVVAYRRLHRKNTTISGRSGQVGGLAKAIKSSLDRRRTRSDG